MAEEYDEFDDLDDLDEDYDDEYDEFDSSDEVDVYGGGEDIDSYTPVYTDKNMSYWDENPAGKLDQYGRILSNTSAFYVDKAYEMRDALQEAIDYLTDSDLRGYARQLLMMVDRTIRESDDLDVQEEIL
jgi:hypothetical protein